MQLYGIGQPLTNQMLKFSGNQFGPQAFGQEEQQQFNNGFGTRPTVQPNQPAFQAPVVPNQAVAQKQFTPQQPTPQQNVFSPFLNQPKMGIPGGMYGPEGTTGNNSVTGGFDINYLTPNRG